MPKAKKENDSDPKTGKKRPDKGPKKPKYTPRRPKPLSKKQVRNVIIVFAITVAVAYLLLCTAFYFFQGVALYRPNTTVDQTPAKDGLAYEDLTLTTSDGTKIQAWYVPCENSTRFVIYCHGNGGNIAYNLREIGIFHELGLNVAVFDYEGYGNSEGDPSEDGTYRDVDVVWHYLADNKNATPKRILLFGHSMGGPISAWCARQHHPAALVLDSTFVSFDEEAQDLVPIVPASLLSTIEYTTLEYAKAAALPTMVLHSKADRTIAYDHGQRIYAGLNEPKRFVEITGGHNDGFTQCRALYIQVLTEFLDRYLPAEAIE